MGLAHRGGRFLYYLRGFFIGLALLQDIMGLSPASGQVVALVEWTLAIPLVIDKLTIRALVIVYTCVELDLVNSLVTCRWGHPPAELNSPLT